MNHTLSIYLLPPVLSLACALYLIVLMLAKGGRTTSRLLFVLVCVWYSFLAPLFILHHLVPDPVTLLAIERGVHFFYVYLPLVMIVYIHHILGIQRNDILGILFGISFIFSLTTQGDLYFNGLNRYSWGYIAKGGPAFQLFGLYGLLVLCYCLWIVRQRLRVETDAALRLKFKYVSFAFGLGTLLTFFNVPAMYGVDFYPLGNFSFLPMAFLTYAVLKHRSVEIGSLIHRCLIHALQILLLLVPNFFVYDWAATHVSALSYEMRFAVLVVWFALNHIYFQHLQRRTDRILQKSHDHLQQIASRLIAEMQVLSNADELARKTAAAMMETLPFAWVHIYLFEETRQELSGIDGHAHVLDDRLVPVLSRFNGVLEHQTPGAGPDLDRLQQPLAQWMDTLKAAYVAPLVHSDGLIGVLAMPRKQNMKSLHAEEAAFIQKITKTLALALSNARIHQHVTTLKDSLQARNDLLNQEIAERERIAQSLLLVQDELRRANQALEKAILQANEMTARAEISNHVLTQEVEDRKRMAHMLQQSEERYRLVADNATDVIWTIDMNGRFTFISPSVEHCLGYKPEEMVDLEIRQVLTPESLKVAEQTIAEELRSVDKPNGIKRTSLATELEQVRKDGSSVWTEVNTRFIKDANRQVVGILGVTRDISERKKTEQELIHLAHHDALTGLLNRKAFVELLETEIKYARRHGSGLVLLYFDMNKFKTVNDTYGHEIGDRLLQSVAVRLKGAVRETDHVARLGGDEFTILLKSPEKILSTIVAQRIVRDLAQPFEYDAVRVDFVTASIGIATFPRDGHTVAELMKSADKAMYQAKKGSVDWLHCEEVIAN